MILENEYGKIEFSENEFNTELKKNLFSEKNERKYNTFLNKSVRDFNSSKLKFRKALLFGPIILGFIYFFSGFQKKVYTEPWKEEWESKYIVENTSWEERLPGLFFVIGGIALGLYMNKRFKYLDEITAFSVIWLDGNKQKKDVVFYVDNKVDEEKITLELNKLKNM